MLPLHLLPTPENKAAVCYYLSPALIDVSHWIALQGALLPWTNCKKCALLSESRLSPWLPQCGTPALQGFPWQWHVLVTGLLYRPQVAELVQRSAFPSRSLTWKSLLCWSQSLEAPRCAVTARGDAGSCGSGRCLEHRALQHTSFLLDSSPVL